MRARLLPTLALSALVLAFAGCGSGESAEPTPTDAAASGCTYTEDAGGVREVDAPSSEPTVSGEVTATMATSQGDITLTLDADRTPCTVESFVSLTEQGYYNDTTCHRLTVEGIFVLQCGDPSATGMGGPGYSYADELDGTETYPAGTLAMANAGTDTNGSQFFLVYEDTRLSPDYTVFGQVDEAGVELIRDVATDGIEADGVTPSTPVDISTITIG